MLSFERPRESDVDELLQLYFLVYGNDYPFQLGTEREAMTKAIRSRQCEWVIVRENYRSRIVGSGIFEIDPFYQISRLSGVVVHPEFQGRQIAQHLIAEGLHHVLNVRTDVRSVYAATRTFSLGPQVMCLKNGFLPLGIFPNAHRVREYETMTLMAKFKSGVLEQRRPVQRVPEKLVPIVSVMNQVLNLEERFERVEHKAPVARRTAFENWEVIVAPAFVKRLFEERFQDPYDKFFPFHEPNMLVVSETGDVEIFGYFRKKDQYCTFIALNRPLSEIGSRLRGFLARARDDFRISYIEILISLEHVESIESLIENQFLPSAIYPAMLMTPQGPKDLVLMSRTMEPLNFREIQVESSFKPYIDQYVSLWKQMSLESVDLASQ